MKCCAKCPGQNKGGDLLTLHYFALRNVKNVTEAAATNDIFIAMVTNLVVNSRATA